MNNPEVIHRVTESFVPVALNTDTLPDTADGRFFRELMRQWPQGLWVVAPDGKNLAHHYHKPIPKESYQAGQDRWLRDTLGMIDTGIKAAGDLTKRNPVKTDALVDRGYGFLSDGGVRLAVSVVGYQKGRREGPPAVDSIRLSKEEWQSVGPPAGKDEWAIPGPIAAKFCLALSPLTDSIFVPKPGDVSNAELTAKIVRRTGDLAIIQYAGCWEARHNRDGDPRFPIRSSAVGDGVAEYDLKTSSIREVGWVLRGTYNNGTAWGTAAVIEWHK